MGNRRRVVITGLGVASPIGLGIEAYWEALLNRQCGIRRLQSFDPSGLGCQVGGELPKLQFADYIPKSYRKSAKVMSRDIVVAIILRLLRCPRRWIEHQVHRGAAAKPPVRPT